MTEPSGILKNICTMRIFTVTFILSVLLIVGGFFCPPIGKIDGSVLSAVGLLLMFATIDKLPDAIKAGKSVKVSKGDFTAQIEAKPPHE